MYHVMGIDVIDTRGVSDTMYHIMVLDVIDTEDVSDTMYHSWS